MSEGEGKIFVKEVFEKFAHSDVGPPAADEQEPLEEAELSDGKVRRHDRLKTLLTRNAHADVRRSVQQQNGNRGNIVILISYIVNVYSY